MNLFFRRLGDGPAIIVLHGLFGSSDNWATVGKHLAGRGYSVYLVDQRNHGKSAHDPEFNFGVMADDLDDFIREQHISQPIILGHSMGGKTAMTYCQLFPGIAHALIVVDIAPRYYEPHHQKIISALRYANPESCSSRKEAEARLQDQTGDQGVTQFLAKNLFWNEQNKLEWRFDLDSIERNIEEMGAAIPDQPQIELPTLFIRGENSDYIKASDEADISRIFLRATIITAPGAGHWVHADTPAWLVETLFMFLGQVS